MRSLGLGALLGLVVAILVVSHLPMGALPSFGLHYRVTHALAYGSLAGLCLFATRERDGLGRVIAVMVSVAVVGAVDEITQPMFGRQCSLLDWLTDVGSACAVVAFWQVARWRVSRPGGGLIGGPGMATGAPADAVGAQGAGGEDEPGS